MDDLKELFDNNKAWAAQVKASDVHFFETLAAQQSPEYLWIGCSDSRVPANEIVGLLPGDLFVHRNIANIVLHTDVNCQSVLQYAVDMLQVKHIIVCGHYGCGGVKAAMKNSDLGLIENWLRNIKDTYQKHCARFLSIEDEDSRIDLLCELNVKKQVTNLCQSIIVQRAWERGKALTVHGLIYDIKDGILKDLEVSVADNEQVPAIYQIKDKR